MKFKAIDLELLFKLMKNNEIMECNLREDNFHIEIKRSQPQLIQSLKNESDAIKSDTTSQKELQNEKSQEENSNLHQIKTPLVGTFFRSSSPDSEPFFEIGDLVNVNDTLCIIEAMKSLNEIKSDIKGIIKDIPVENGDLVEYDQLLFKIQPV